MLSLCNEIFLSFCVIMLLLLLDFHINIPCLCYDNLLILSCLLILVIQQQKLSQNLHEISFLLESTLPNVAQRHKNFAVYLLIQSAPETSRNSYHLHFEFQCELVLACWWKKPCFSFNFCFSPFGSLGLFLAASQPVQLDFSCRILTEISQSPHLYHEVW